MKKLRMLGIALLTLAGAATFAPAAMAAHPNAGVPHAAKANSGSHHTSTVSGKLQSYTAGVGATLTVSAGARHAASAKALHVGISFHTRVDYAGKNHAAPFPAKGDNVVVKVNWSKNSAHATTLTYDDHGSPPGGGEDGTSRFHGAYDLAASSSTVLALTEENGTVDQFALTANTVYFENGQQVTSPTLTDGERLAVEATQQPDGSWAADSVIIGDHHGDHGGDGQGEDFHGVFVSNTATTLTIADEDGGDSQTFTVDGNTKYFDQNGNSVPSLTYTAGEKLHVQATEQSDGTWLATSVSTATGHEGHGENHDFHGTYSASDATTLTIVDGDGNAETFTVDANTMFFDQNGNSVPSLTYTAGEALRVKATHQPDGTWLATEVSAQAGEGHGGGESEHFGGTYQSDTPTSLVITDKDGNTDTFTLDSHTQYFDQNGNSVPSLTYAADEPLRVEATQQSDGSWLATTVSASSQDDHGGD